MYTDVYEFKFDGERRCFSYKFVAKEDDTHLQIVEQFLDFLSTVYGYDLREEYLSENSTS